MKFPERVKYILEKQRVKEVSVTRTTLDQEETDSKKNDAEDKEEGETGQAESRSPINLRRKATQLAAKAAEKKEAEDETKALERSPQQTVSTDVTPSGGPIKKEETDDDDDERAEMERELKAAKPGGSSWADKLSTAHPDVDYGDLKSKKKQKTEAKIKELLSRPQTDVHGNPAGRKRPFNPEKAKKHQAQMDAIKRARARQAAKSDDDNTEREDSERQLEKRDWIKKAAASIKKRGTEGKCTPIDKPGCTGRAEALAKTFKKIKRKRSNKT
jgi:hypothetical protein